MYKTQNQIYKDFKTFTETALNAPMQGYSVIAGWSVKKLHQTIKTEDLKPSVFIQITSKKQAGAQYRKNLKTEIEEEETLQKIYCSKKEITVRLSASRRFLIEDTAETYNAIDVLDKIKAYFQSIEGLNMLAAQNYAMYRPSDIQEQSFTNDDENIQLLPYFDCVYLYTDEWQTKINEISKVEEKLKKGV